MPRKLHHRILAAPLALLILALICLPAAGLVYLAAWALDGLFFDIDFGSWVTHAVVWGVALVGTIGSLNTDEGNELSWKLFGFWW